ncbi:hypothetical protein AN958_00195 [Leucoagaricus sp. SymC.cos]|nr:hypothetical protein AN958_00195 [Leucoagaricus sp. SymC.cos]
MRTSNFVSERSNRSAPFLRLGIKVVRGTLMSQNRQETRHSVVTDNRRVDRMGLARVDDELRRRWNDWQVGRKETTITLCNQRRKVY